MLDDADGTDTEGDPSRALLAVSMTSAEDAGAVAMLGAEGTLGAEAAWVTIAVAVIGGVLTARTRAATTACDLSIGTIPS